jgi:SAM-dependent methyltransferase
MTDIANVEMATAWDGQEGDDWARDWERYDRAVAGYQAHLFEAAGVAPDERVLDVGCGNGESSRAAGRLATEGSVLGIDLSTRMLERARQLASVEGLVNVAFERGDAQVHPFPEAAYTMAVSRFGAMFFADRVAALSNIGRSLVPGGGIVLVAWQELARNEWLLALRGALAAGRDLPVPPLGAPGPFGLADPDGVESALTSAGFEAVAMETIAEPFWVGADTDDATRFVGSSAMARGLLEGLDEGARIAALGSLREVAAEHETPDGVFLGSSAWLISARRSEP